MTSRGPIGTTVSISLPVRRAAIEYEPGRIREYLG
jgi:hypothetical protein